MHSSDHLLPSRLLQHFQVSHVFCDKQFGARPHALIGALGTTRLDL